MSDYIDRQAAIDEAKHYIEIGYDSDIIHTLENLPSAQPEIIRCKDCKHYGEYISRTNEIAMMCFCPCYIGGQGKKNPDDFCSRAERRANDKIY